MMGPNNTDVDWSIGHVSPSLVHISGSIQTDGYIQALKKVSASTAGTGSPGLISMSESRSVFTNEGTTVLNGRQLPQCSGGLSYGFAIQDADGIRIYAGSGNTIRIDANVTISSGYVESTTVGSYLDLLGINNTQWFATHAMGVWAVQTS
jgi:hypothetical protein